MQFRRITPKTFIQNILQGAFLQGTFLQRAFLIVALCTVAIPGAYAQAGLSEEDIASLNEAMPRADSFSGKTGEPPVYRAFADAEDGGEPALVGYLFETSDYPPEEIGYSAPIEVLVGMDLEGNLTGIKILFYRESYKSIRGDFLNTEQFPFQFKGMSVSDGFRVGRDVNGVSRATITSWATTRGIRNAARQVARAYLADSAYVASQNSGAVALAILAAQSWEEMIDSGLVKQLKVLQGDLTELDLSFAFLGGESLGELMVGAGDYSRADREASSRVEGGQMLLVGIAGNSSQPFRQERLAVMQGEEVFPVERRRFVYVGSADSGKITDKVRFAGALVLNENVDIAKPFTVLYNSGIEASSYAEFPQIEYQLPPVALALTQGTPLPAEFLPPMEDAYGEYEYEEEGVFESLINNASWSEVGALLVLLALVMTAFLRKSSKIRWLSLAYTLGYLGFYNGTFLSVSHITNGIKLGPSLFLNDLPLLLLVVFTLVTTFFWGRIFCSSLCPFGALQDFLTRFVPRKWQRELPQAIHDKAIYIKYGILALLLITALAYSELSIFQYFEPFATLFYFSQSMLLWSILIVLLLASSMISRFYCRYACPLGAALGVTALISPWRIKRVQQCDICKVCERACPTRAIRGPKIDFKECVRCDVCEIKLIGKAGVCKHSVADVAARHKTWTPVTIA